MDAGRETQRYSYVVRGRTLRCLNVQVGKVKEPWFDCGGWEGWGLEDDYQVTEGKFGGRQQWDHRNLLDTDGEGKTVAVGVEVSERSGPGSGAQSLGELGCPGSVERLACRLWFEVARWGECEEGWRQSWMLEWPSFG